MVLGDFRDGAERLPLSKWRRRWHARNRRRAPAAPVRAEATITDLGVWGASRARLPLLGRIPSRTFQYTLDAQGEPVPATDGLAWAQWLESAAASRARIVAQTEIGPYWVSTVFLGMDHNWGGGAGPPILWETMVFGEAGPDGRRRVVDDNFGLLNDGSIWGDCSRYSSLAMARYGHAQTVAAVEAANERRKRSMH